LEGTNGTTADDLDDGLSWTEAIDLAQNRPLWRLLATCGAYTLVVVQVGDDDDDDLIGALHNL